MTLSNIIRAEISKNDGHISFARFMQMALYQPEYGYYSAAREIFGKDGDFVTAPEISPLYAQCIAANCQDIFAETGAHDFAELGAGSGKFARDILLALEKSGCLPERYIILETSPVLRERQMAFLKESVPQFFARIHWVDELPDNIRGMIFANEVLDALPAHCFTIKNHTIYERCVGVKDGQFVWVLQPANSALCKSVEKYCDLNILPDGYSSEMCLMSPEWITAIAKKLGTGMLLLADYGYGKNEYYHPARRHGTLTCFYQHRAHDNPLIHPGLQDITAHVNFTQIAESVTDAGLFFSGFTDQAAFLLGSGLSELTGTDWRTAQAAKTLLLPTEMGEVVKMAGFVTDDGFTIRGFSLADRSGRL